MLKVLRPTPHFHAAGDTGNLDMDGDLNVGGNTLISGNLQVNGTFTMPGAFGWDAGEVQSDYDWVVSRLHDSTRGCYYHFI